MSENTKIEWADNTFNPWIGCTKVSPGCAHCYAENTTRARVLRSKGQETWGKGKPRSRTSAATWRNPLKWNRAADTIRRHCTGCGKDFESCWYREPTTIPCPGCGAPAVHVRARVFPSLCDWLDDEVPIEWLADFLKIIHDTSNLDWLLLTKRPENWRSRIEESNRSIARVGCSSDSREHSTWQMCSDWLGGKAPANVWIGASAEDQPRADERIPELLKIPAKVRFLSVEPLLGGVSLTKIGHDYEYTDALRGLHRQFNSDGQCRESKLPKIDWVIVGGESGPGARACNVEWIRSIVRQCKAAGVPCFVKQLGSVVVSNGCTVPGQHWPESRVLSPKHEFHFQGEVLWRHNLIHKKGGDPMEWPEDLRVREFPKL